MSVVSSAECGAYELSAFFSIAGQILLLQAVKCVMCMSLWPGKQSCIVCKVYAVTANNIVAWKGML